jgi:hypothetical protein
VLVDEDFDDAAHPKHRDVGVARERHGFSFEDVDAKALADALLAAGFASAEGARITIAGCPANQVRATR